MKQEIKKIDTHNYLIPFYVITDNGLEKLSYDQLPLVRGSKKGEGVEKQGGYITENLLEVCLTYMEDVNSGKMNCSDNDEIIRGLNISLAAIRKRANDRKKRQVQNTYSK